MNPPKPPKKQKKTGHIICVPAGFKFVILKQTDYIKLTER